MIVILILVSMVFYSIPLTAAMCPVNNFNHELYRDCRECSPCTVELFEVELRPCTPTEDTFCGCPPGTHRDSDNHCRGAPCVACPIDGGVQSKLGECFNTTKKCTGFGAISKTSTSTTTTTTPQTTKAQATNNTASYDHTKMKITTSRHPKMNTTPVHTKMKITSNLTMQSENYDDDDQTMTPVTVPATTYATKQITHHNTTTFYYVLAIVLIAILIFLVVYCCRKMMKEVGERRRRALASSSSCITSSQIINFDEDGESEESQKKRLTERARTSTDVQRLPDRRPTDKTSAESESNF